jgi:hypothetical protein
MTLRQLGASMDSAELQAWKEYYALEPWGEERMDLRFARLMAQIHNALKSTGSRALSAADFLLDFLSDPDDKDSATQQAAAFMTMAGADDALMLDDDVDDEDIEAALLGGREMEADIEFDYVED